LPGVTSAIDGSLSEAKNKILKGEPAPASGVSMARFWFHIAPGCPKFSEDEGIIWLRKCAVVLLTEKQMSTTAGELRDAPGDDPTAQAFAAELSKVFPQLTVEVREYADLENLFRLRAVVLAMNYRRSLSTIRSDCNSYLGEYRYRGARVMPDSLPGLANFRQWSQESRQGNTVMQYFMFCIACGGVGMDMTVSQQYFRREPTKSLAIFRKAAIQARPSPEALFW
jgi:hypothetical protein